MIKSSAFIKRFKIWTWMILALIVIISYITLFLPYRFALEIMTLENFVLTSKASVSTIDQFILRNRESAKRQSHNLIEHGPVSDLTTR